MRNANSDTSKYNTAVRKLSNEQKKGSKANAELVESLKKEVVEKRNAMNQSNGLVNGYRQEAAAAKTTEAATKAQAAGLMTLSKAADVAKLALAAVGPALVIAGIGAFVQSIQDAKKHADNLKASTTELEAAAAGAKNEVKEEAGAFDVLTGSTGSAKADIDKMLESQAQLATTLKETNTSAAAQSAQLTAAYDTIREYANKSDLSTEAQGRLRAAVDTVNSMCGTQISVVDQANGKLADEHGAIDDVTGALGEYVEKKLNQIRVDAQQSNLTALYEQQAQDLQTLAVAQKNFNDEVDRRVSITPGLTREDAAAAMAWSQQGIALREAKEALGAVNSSIDTVTESLGASVAVADGATASVKDLAAASPAVSSAFVGLGGDIGQFCDDLQNAGISVEDFQSLNDEQLVKLATSWDGTTGSIIKALGDMGIKCKTEGQAAADQLGQRPKRGRAGSHRRGPAGHRLHARGVQAQLRRLRHRRRRRRDGLRQRARPGRHLRRGGGKGHGGRRRPRRGQAGRLRRGNPRGRAVRQRHHDRRRADGGQRGGAGRSAGERHLHRPRRRIRDWQLRRSWLRAGHRRQHAADI